MLKTFQRAVETPYQVERKRAANAKLGWPQYECPVGLDAQEREFVASIGRLESTDRDDERKLAIVIKDLIRKLMAQHEELKKERQQANG
jgi:hypothetical protein